MLSSSTCHFDITPVPKPRMTQRDAWAKRPCVLRYYEFKDQLKALAAKERFTVPAAGCHVTFYLPRPKSWPKTKKTRFAHQQKPDIDNLLKAFLDALCDDDSYVYDIRATKLWHTEGRIVVTTLEET